MWPFNSSKREFECVTTPIDGVRSRTTVPGGYIESDNNALNEAFLVWKSDRPKRLGNYSSFVAAREAVRSAYNEEVEEWNFQAAFGPP